MIFQRFGQNFDRKILNSGFIPKIFIPIMINIDK